MELSPADFALVRLDCPSCGAPLAAEGEDIVYYCTACRNGYRYAEQAGAPKYGGLRPVEVSFVVAPEVAVELYRPFWLLPARVTVEGDAGIARSVSGLMSFLLGKDDSARPADGQGTFAVPAFHARLEAVVDLTRRYTERFPQLGERLGERLLGGCYGEEDARKLARYALVASEVAKPGVLRTLRYEIEFGETRLLGVPFLRRGEVLVDALFGVRV